jgi:hypothetical protein
VSKKQSTDSYETGFIKQEKGIETFKGNKDGMTLTV